MPPDTVHVIATFFAASGKEAEMESALQELLEPTRRESGCIRYDLIRAFPGEGYAEFVFVEEWASVEELDAHGRMPHIQGLRPRIKDLMGSPARVIRYRQVG
ncbi:MAG TPA: putative quinol monooxygenase [Thermoanaerobaculia bacterium]|jgi:quinol monooxygenase YgiN